MSPFVPLQPPHPHSIYGRQTPPRPHPPNLGRFTKICPAEPTMRLGVLVANRTVRRRKCPSLSYHCLIRDTLAGCIVNDHERLYSNNQKGDGSRRYFSKAISKVVGGSWSHPIGSRQRHNTAIVSNSFHRQHQVRTVVSWLPEALQSFSIWGGSGWALKTLHGNDFLPYWACFSAISIIVRVALFPVVLYGARTAARFAKVVPEVQFLITLFQNDMKKLRERNAPVNERVMLMKTNMATLGGVYKLHNINPLYVFLSPLLQLPFFLYISVDLRKIVNGLDPLFAQTLVDSPVAWIPDLTEADPWYGLPIMAGLAMYANVEAAVGKRSLSGQAASKSDTALFLKDMFQSCAVFMPCFTAQLPAGVQIYIVTSFVFTIAQSMALRTDGFRQMVGLPSMLAPPPEAKYAKEFIELKKLEQKARELRGDGPVLGKGVLAANFEASFPGTYRPSTIKGSGIIHVASNATAVQSPLQMGLSSSGERTVMKLMEEDTTPSMPYIHGITAPRTPRTIQEEPVHAAATDTVQTQEREYMPLFSDEVMEKANRGERPVETKIVAVPKSKSPSKLSLKRFEKGKDKRKK